ncbi:MAG: CAP domain-containing protein [Thermoleophilaceae bacterium]
MSLALPAAAHAGVRERGMVDELNRVRAKHDLPALRASESLEGSAFAYAGRLMESGWFGHAGSISAPPGFRMLGETLSVHRGRRLRRARTVRRWLRSPTHRALILSRQFAWVGAGYSRGRFRGRRATIWVLHLGGGLQPGGAPDVPLRGTSTARLNSATSVPSWL